MQSSKYELIRQHIDSFPVLPITVTRLMRVTNDPDCSVKEVVAILHSDQSLCLTILKIANSVLFGRPQKVDSIKMAVVILGFNEVQRIAMTKALINSFGKLARQHKPFIDRFWHHSFVCGMAAGLIAQDLDISTEIAFMGGLIHDIGKLIMLQTFTEEYAPKQWMAELSNEQTLYDELQMYSFTHDILGGQLLQKWFFPDSLITAVAYHHRPERAVRETVFAHCIQLADFLSFQSCNRQLLDNDTLIARMHATLPGLQSRWLEFSRPLQDAVITGWFDWLVANHDQGYALSEAYSP